jgi:hypothetical protein
MKCFSKSPYKKKENIRGRSQPYREKAGSALEDGIMW